MKGWNRHLGMALGLALAALPGCSKPSSEQAHHDGNVAQAATAPAPAPAPTQASADDAAIAAKSMFKSRCSVCHGMSGKGDGPGAAALNPKPRDYTNTDWQKSVSDEDIKNTILLGGAAIGKSPAMPASPDLQSKPEVLSELVKIVRSYSH